MASVIEAVDLRRTYETTTIKMLIPTSGTARVLGRDVVKDAKWERERIGYAFGDDRATQRDPRSGVSAACRLPYSARAK